jgi:hypothetical protein
MALDFFEPVPVVSRNDENLTMDVEIQINKHEKFLSKELKLRVIPQLWTK